ncbi:hypothetical protein PRIPAC_76949 [Pristionchus pacificus]|uniref:Uncharacterized protein n=1 Tax=Pristionchus pacificus TaxID=54126 RepID=A0A2A6C4M1_PRIPA|nr:hypothetical protein PRIPAC_76949 [Pristionchus pacificus]|eukprot:PDM73066.1 hypothetical protein PRIPAC_39500 [Pristionchus pacificus]
MKPYSPQISENRYLLIYISQSFIYPSLFCIYLVLIAISFTAGFLFAALLLHHRQTFHFSFHLILLQIIWCGIAKCLIRAISYVEFDGIAYLYAIELMFDFGLLLFIVSMAFNRLFVVITPPNCFIYSNKILQCIFVLLVWLCSICVMCSFITHKCQRSIYEDGRLIDSCLDIFKDDLEKNNYGILSLVFFIRKMTYISYDILPLLCAILYAISTLSLIYKRRLLAKTRNSEWEVFLHGLLIFCVYGIATVINYVLTLYEAADLSGAIAQFLMFIYITLDVITVLLIPLSTFLTVPALRRYPCTIIRRCMKHSDSRVFSLHGTNSPHNSPLPPPVIQMRRLTVASIRFK